MYSIGDKIVYPMHGAGIIESIEEREILGERQKYYVLKMPVGDMKVMIPTKSAGTVGIRDIISSREVNKVFDVFKIDTTDENINWNKRYRENMLKIKTGNIYEVADVVRTLIIREKDRGLSTGERKMLSSAKQILVSELVLANDMKPEDIEVLINDNMQ